MAMAFATARFFFQADDGIRVRDVTGVQTCALPISFSQNWGQVVRMLAGATLPSQAMKIGRASCRERVESLEVAVKLKEERKRLVISESWRKTTKAAKDENLSAA